MTEDWQGTQGSVIAKEGLAVRVYRGIGRARDGILDDCVPRRWSGAFVPAPVTRRTIPLLEFLQRFTPEERTAIRAPSTVNPDLADWIDHARFAREIELDAPTTAAGLDALVAAGLLTAERSAAVLAERCCRIPASSPPRS